ncbi:MAG: T9SS type A sorting domain-containing protein [Burkholderiales bacterium]|nr:T9SS type A sorting domain-containing protein [Bacteroidia bacterium]
MPVLIKNPIFVKVGEKCQPLLFQPMLKKILCLFSFLFLIDSLSSQILYSEHFNTLSLNTGTYTNNSNTYLYANVPNGMFTINTDSLKADTLSGNYPFRANGQKQKAWLSYMPYNGTDTFAVSTSWINPIGTANAWLITPTIANIDSSSVLTWEAMAPDINNSDGYEVYVTTITTLTPSASDFSTIIFSTTAEKNNWQTHGISLAAFKNQSIRIAFKNNSSNKYQLWIDDISVANISNGFDAGAVSHDVYKYSSVSSNNIITATFKNYGFSPISNLTVNYKMDNGPTISEIKILSPALNYLESRSLSFSFPYNTVIPQHNTFKIWSSTINGQIDQVKINDTITGDLTISASVPQKKVLVEQFTSALCGWCPEGYTVLSSIVSTNTNVIAASIHDNDNMSTPEGNILITDYAPDFPSASIDQYYFSANDGITINRNNWGFYTAQRLAMKVPATVAVTNFSYNIITRQIDATVSSTFVGDVKGDYRLNLYIKENNVYGPSADLTDNQWNQHSSLFNVGASPYYQLGSYLNADTNLLSPGDYKHQYVVNKMMHGSYGAPGIIPTIGSTIGQTYSITSTYTLPVLTTGEFRYNADNIYLIGVLSEYNSDLKKRAILNVAEVKLTSNTEVLVGIKEITTTDLQLNVFPNPATDACTLTYSLNNNEFVKVSVYNTLGALVYIETKNVNAGNVIHSLNLNALSSGNYSVQVSFKNNIITKKLTIIK